MLGVSHLATQVARTLLAPSAKCMPRKAVAELAFAPRHSSQPSSPLDVLRLSQGSVEVDLAQSFLASHVSALLVLHAHTCRVLGVPFFRLQVHTAPHVRKPPEPITDV